MFLCSKFEDDIFIITRVKIDTDEQTRWEDLISEIYFSRNIERSNKITKNDFWVIAQFFVTLNNLLPRK